MSAWRYEDQEKGKLGKQGGSAAVMFVPLAESAMEEGVAVPRRCACPAPSVQI